ncbi:MAG: GNAT family N-acetyltransferase [Bacteroidales bacterium]
MEPIIAPIDKRLIIKELSNIPLLKKTNKGDNELYVLNNHNAPNTMLEIGRLREISFRHAGGGTGKAYDIDKYDQGEKAYEQLIVWDKNASEILGGYRYIYTKDCNSEELATSELFKFSNLFFQTYQPYSLELGRSFIQPDYQGTRRNSKALYTLDNLWDGIGGVINQFSDVKYLIGKVTMYPSYNTEARNIVLYFLDKYFPDKEKLLTPIIPLVTNAKIKEIDALFNGKTYTEDYKILSRTVRSLGEFIPPLINSYMNLSSTMKSFGTAINHEFGQVEETGILITLADVYPEKVERHFIDALQKRGRRLNQLFSRRSN